MEESTIVSNNRDTVPKECPHISVVNAENRVTREKSVTREAKEKLG